MTAAVLALLLFAGAGFGYYPFVHYMSASAPFQAASEKFDLNALPNRTLYYLVSAKGPERLAPGDSFASVLTQIRLAARAWSEVETSVLRFEFGGLAPAGVTQTTPGVDVFFGEVELPPGLIALGGPTSRSPLISSDSGAFVPITRSILVLGRDLSQRPSYSSAFFLTVVHELGHALGLQHTMTSAVMSTEVTRSATRSKPLAADDIAGISLLYPAPSFARRTGSISGRVTLDGQGVHLASVAALEPAGAAVSTLTDPEGYFRISGLAQGQYYIYVQPLPPGGQPELGPAEIVLPVLPDGSRVPAGPLFETVFYPGVKDVLKAGIVTVTAGKDTPGYDFAVRARGPLEVYGVTTYSFPGSIAVKPAFVNVNGTRRFLVAYGKGLTTNSAPTPGLAVSVIGGSATVLGDGLAAYAPAPSFLQIGLGFSPFGGEGPRHMIFSSNNDLYVLPAAMYLVRSQPPSVAGVVAGTDAEGRRTAVVSGSNFMPSTRVLFDGLPAAVTGMDAATGALTVLLPQGASSHQAVVTALDTDGQDSLFLNGASPPTFTYDAAPAPSVVMSPAALAAGSESMVEITGVNTRFAAGRTQLGFGSSDVVVRRVWVLGPDRLLANVSVAAVAKTGILPLTAVTDFQTVTTDSALDVQPQRLGTPVASPVVVNPDTGQPSIYAGGRAVLTVAEVPAGLTPASFSITVDGLPATVTAVEGASVRFVVPSSLRVGPAVLRLTAAGLAAAPVVVAIDPAPPVILGVRGPDGGSVGAESPAIIGETIWVTVTGLSEPAILEDPSRLVLTLGGVPHTPIALATSDVLADTYDARIRISAEVQPGGAVPLTAAVGARASQAIPIPVRASLP